MADYSDLGYDNLLSKEADVDLSDGITQANSGEVIGSNSITYDQTSLRVIGGNQTIKSANFVGGQTGWIIRGDGSAEFQSLAAGEFVRVYSQASEPTSGMTEGDIWYDTDDGNKRYIYQSGAWVEDTSTANWSEVVDDEPISNPKPEDGATIGADWDANLSNIPDSATASYITSTKITTTTIESPSITAGTLTGSTIKTNDVAYPWALINSSGIAVHGTGFFFRDSSGGNETSIGISGSDLVINPTGDVAINGGAGGVTLKAYGATTLDLNVGSIVAETTRPLVDGGYDLGTSSYGWRYLYLGSAGRYLYDNSGTLYFNGSPVGGGGTVTSVATSGAITGGTITTTGTISHSTSSGYKHIPSSGSTYQQLYNSASGTASWSSRTYVGGNSGTYFERSVSGRINSVVDLTATGSLHATGNVYTGGISANDGSVNCAVVSGNTGSLTLNLSGRLQVSTHFDPPNGGSYNTGGSTRYWGDVSYKTLTDRGCLGWFDNGVEMQDGTIVSDIEAIKSMKKDDKKTTIYGVPMLDYKSFPKVSYIKAKDNDGNEYPRDENDEPIEVDDVDADGNTIKLQPQDGIEMTSVFSIMIGAFKELAARIEALEAKDKI